MKPTTRATLIFATAYALLAIPGIFLLFSWGSFGGNAHLNPFQKVVWALLAYPAKLIPDMNSIWIYILLNTAFWTAMFYLTLTTLQTLKKRSRK